MEYRVAFSLVAITLALSPAKSMPAQGYTYTSIDFPGAVETAAAGINNHGQIVGEYLLADGSRHGFLYSGGTFTTVDDPNNTTSSEALGINDSGQIVGAYTLNSLEGAHQFEGVHAFVDNGGTFTTLDYPAAGVDHTTANKINNSGSIVGVYRISGSPGIGFLYQGGTYTTVNVPAPGCCTHDNGINNAGNIVGQYKSPNASAPHQGFIDVGGVFTTLDYPGATDTWAEDINNHGDVVGFYSTGTAANGFLYDGATFSTISYPGAAASEALGINDQGDVVGGYQDSSGVIHGFLATPISTIVHVSIDIKPGSCPNPINLGANGDLPVAILGTAGFNVAEVNPASVRLQGVPAVQSALADVATPYTGPLTSPTSCTTAGSDGFLDLVLHFSDQAVVAALGKPADGQMLILTLTGNLLPQYGGTAIKGQDAVIIRQ